MYELKRYDEYDYSQLHNIKVNRYRGKGRQGIYNNAIIMLDTETSKSGPTLYDRKGDVIPQPNYVVAFTISIRWNHENICTLYGNKPTECMDCLKMLRDNMPGTLFIYIFNLPYDWMFLRQFFFKWFGYPKKQLCIKSHNPILFEFENDIILKDAYALAGRKLSKWAEDLGVEHQKECGAWNYDLIRQQNNYVFTPDELRYIEHDTLAGVECLDATMTMLHCNISTIPYTVTGIMRNEVRKIGEKNNAHDRFLKFCPDPDTQLKLEKAFHGGYTHGNRYFYSKVNNNVKAFDFCSSYPFIMLAFRVPRTKFCKLDGIFSISDILEDSEEYAFLFKLVVFGVDLKDYLTPMPYLQFSKCEAVINPVLDNGRIVKADYVEIFCTEYDLMILNSQYSFAKHACVQVEYSYKDYLPRWYTDFIFSLFYDKCTLKGKDKILYNLQKGKINAGYGNMVTKGCRVTIEENFETGKYKEKEDYNFYKEYEKYKKKRKSILNYAWGVWVTAIAAYNLFELQKCVDYENGGKCLYCDTDSCYATKWNETRLNEYNQKCKDKLKDNNYGPVYYEGKEFCLGVAELDGVYSEFVYLGAKRYCARDAETNKLKITVAGVPKSGVDALNDDIKNFKKGFCFPGSVTGKLTHSYIYKNEIYIDKNGNEIGDSIDLNECSYILDEADLFDMNDYIEVNEDVARNFR